MLPMQCHAICMSRLLLEIIKTDLKEHFRTFTTAIMNTKIIILQVNDILSYFLYKRSVI